MGFPNWEHAIAKSSGLAPAAFVSAPFRWRKFPWFEDTFFRIKWVYHGDIGISWLWTSIANSDWKIWVYKQINRDHLYLPGPMWDPLKKLKKRRGNSPQVSQVTQKKIRLGWNILVYHGIYPVFYFAPCEFSEIFTKQKTHGGILGPINSRFFGLNMDPGMVENGDKPRDGR